MKKGNKSSSLRRSRSLEHLYESAKFSGHTRRSPSPLVKRSPSIPEGIDDLSTHIYASIDKTRKISKQDKEKEKEKEEEVEQEEVAPRLSPAKDVDSDSSKHSSPPPPVPPFNAHVYATVSKTGTMSEPDVDMATKSFEVKRTPPPVPQPYFPTTQNISTTPTESAPPTAPAPPTVVTVPTQSASKYSHLLRKKLPPSHTPPPPPSENNLLQAVTKLSPHPPSSSVDIKRTRHDYEQIDFFDDLSSSSQSSYSSSPAAGNITLSLPTGKLRELKPKDRPAPPPPPPAMKKPRPVDPAHNVIVSNNYSTCV